MVIFANSQLPEPATLFSNISPEACFIEVAFRRISSVVCVNITSITKVVIENARELFFMPLVGKLK